MVRLLHLLPTSLLLFTGACTCLDTRDMTKLESGAYLVSAVPDHPFGNHWNTSRDRALKKADAYCQSKNRKMLVEDINKDFRSYVTFRCLDVDDPAFGKTPR